MTPLRARRSGIRERHQLHHETTPTFDNCSFVSAVDNGWFASGVIVVRQAMPELASLVNSLLGQMNFSIFYDNGVETSAT